jgi:hypothetical protein
MKATGFLFNITLGSESLIQAVYDTGLGPLIIENLKFWNPRIQKVAVSVIFNITDSGNAAQIQQLIFGGAIEALCESLNNQGILTKSMILSTLENILNKVSEHRSVVKKMIRGSGRVDDIRKLKDYVDLSDGYPSFNNLLNKLLEEFGEDPVV